MTAIEPTEITEPDEVVQRDDAVRCRGCDHELTTRKQAIEVSGAHDHTFRNPAGYSYQIVCFSDAAGCGAEGALTTDATWFPGYTWNFARCGGCAGHVGWWYVGESSFVGLIATRIG
ncbi:MAG: hypothetical protein HYX32_03255 [Actinobacteria bacterium]|nr:hypothetical protein [Actinomycetota bacterium]